MAARRRHHHLADGQLWHAIDLRYQQNYFAKSGEQAEASSKQR
jgi:hypothetical protein